MLNKFNQIVKKLNQLDKTMNASPRDSEDFMKANKQSDHLIFNKLTPQDYGLIVQNIGRQLTNKDFAKVIIACQKGEPISKVFDLPASVEMALQLRFYQRETKLNQSDFAKKYNIRQSQLSKMESGHQQVDVNFFQKVLRSLGKTFMIA